MKVKTMCTEKRAKLVIAVMWIIAMICAVPEIPIRVNIIETRSEIDPTQSPVEPTLSLGEVNL